MEEKELTIDELKDRVKQLEKELSDEKQSRLYWTKQGDELKEKYDGLREALKGLVSLTK